MRKEIRAVLLFFLVVVIVSGTIFGVGFSLARGLEAQERPDKPHRQWQLGWVSRLGWRSPQSPKPSFQRGWGANDESR